MDAELIEHCLDRLSELDSNATEAGIKEGNGDFNGKHIKLKFKKFIAVVVTVAVLPVGTISASALFLM